jgi:hypothetical protein
MRTCHGEILFYNFVFLLLCPILPIKVFAIELSTRSALNNWLKYIDGDKNA